MQVKTQVAIAVAHWHVLDKKKAENATAHAEWVRKAELALSKADEGLARTALERSIPFESAVRNFSEQLEDQSQQVELLKATLQQLESKLAESRSQAEILIARYRRARSAQRAAAAAAPDPSEAAFSRMGSRVAEAEGQAFASQALLHGAGATRLEDMDKAAKIELLLANLRARIAD